MTTRTVAWSNASWASASVSAVGIAVPDEGGEQVGLVRLGRGHVFEQEFHGLPDIFPEELENRPGGCGTPRRHRAGPRRPP